MSSIQTDPGEFNPYEAPEPEQVRGPGAVGPYLTRNVDPDEVELLSYSPRLTSLWSTIRADAFARFPRAKRPLGMFAFLGIYLFAVGYLTINSLLRRHGISGGQSIAIAGGILVLFAPLLRILQLMVGLVRGRKIIPRYGLQTVSAAPGYLSIRNAHRDVKVSWASISKFVNNRWEVVLVSDLGLVLYVSKSFFPSPDAAEQFVQQIRTYLPTRP